MSKKHTILIADDESYIREFVAQVLSEHFRILFARNGHETVSVAKQHKPSLIVLDVHMPGLDGIEACRQIRQDSEIKNTPILILSAFNEAEKRIQAFQAGVDDFISKPFLPDELVARINRKLENSSAETNQDTASKIHFGNLKLHFEKLDLEIEGDTYNLGQVEYKILNFLIKNRGQLVSRQELNDYVWGETLPSERALDPHITSLRKKLEKSDSELKTVYGKGYSIILKERGS